MPIELLHPQALHIKTNYGSMAYGGNQSWYPSFWKRQSGCGPTCAATVSAYLAQTREGYERLYPYKALTQADFAKHMDAFFQWITPGPMGVNKVDKYVQGMLGYTKEQGVTLQYDQLVVDSDLTHRSHDELLAFMKEHLSQDRPIAFLSLDSHGTPNLQNWHWITLTAMTLERGQIVATASDEGRQRTFNLSTWYRTTRRHGGLIAFY